MGFDAAFAAAVEASVQPGDETPEGDLETEAPAEEPSGPPRDPETGRFLPKEEAAEEESETPAEETPPAADDDSEWAVRYREAQSIIGRQGKELGDLKARLEALEEERNAPPEPEPVAITPEVVESISDMVAEHGGISTLQWVLENHPELEDVVFTAWLEQDDSGQALLFRQDYKLEKIKQEILAEQAAAAPPPPPPEQRLQAVIADVKKGVPDFDQLDLVKAGERAPAAIQRLLQSEDVSEQKDAVEALVLIARATQAPKPGGGNPAARAAAQVATGSLRPAEGGDAPVDRDDLIRQAIAGQQATSVASGLTFGG